MVVYTVLSIWTAQLRFHTLYARGWAVWRAVLVAPDRWGRRQRIYAIRLWNARLAQRARCQGCWPALALMPSQRARCLSRLCYYYPVSFSKTLAIKL